MNHLRILYEDEWLLVIVKPAGVLTHPPEDRSIPFNPNKCATEILKKQLNYSFLSPCHRLDRLASGILIFGKKREFCSYFQKELQAGSVYKKYHVAVRGNLIHPTTIEDKTGEYPESRIVTRVNPLYSKLISEINGVNPWITLAEVFITGGKTHQIRRHLSSISHPLIGDQKHGDKKVNAKYKSFWNESFLYLTCTEIRFCHPETLK